MMQLLKEEGAAGVLVVRVLGQNPRANKVCLSASEQGRLRITGHNVRTKRFLLIKRDIIEQNKHFLSNMESWECHQMKIIKGK